MATTEVETKVQYTVEDHASAGAEKIAHAFEHVNKRSEEVREKLGETFQEGRHHALGMAAGILGVGFGFEQVFEKVKEANVEFANAKRGVQGILFSMLDWPKGVSAVEKVTASQEASEEVMENLEKVSYRFATGLTDVSDAYKLVTVSTGRFHMNQEQLLSLTEKAIGAHRIFGVSGAEAADAIGKTLLTKTVRATGEFGKYLKASLGDIHKLNNQQILAKLNKALSDLPAAGEKMATGLDSSIFRIHHTVEQLIRGLTGPTFTAVAKKLEEWAEYLQKATENGKPLIEVYGQKLLDFLREAKKDVEFLFEHWKAIAAIWAASKFGGAGGIGGMLGGLGGKLGAGMLGGEVGVFAGKLAAATPALAAFALAAQVAADNIEGAFSKRLDNAAVAQGLGAAFGELGKAIKAKSEMASYPGHETEAEDYIREHFRKASKYLADQGLVAEDGRLKLERFNEVVAAVSDDALPKLADQLKVSGAGTSKGLLGAAASEQFGRLFDKFAPVVKAAAAPETIDATKLKTAGKAPVNIYGGIHITQDFKDQDPDRVWIRMREDIEAQAMNRVTAQTKEPFAE